MAITFNFFWLSIYTLLVATVAVGLYWKVQKFCKKHFGN